MLQSVDRSLRALEIISRHPAGITATQLADTLEIHRSGIYRLVDTLIAHGLVTRADTGRLRLGGGILTLAARFAPHLQQASDHVLHELAAATGATSFLAVNDGDQCVIVGTAEPDDLVIRIGYRVGSRHSLRTGAAGIAILSVGAAHAGDSTEVRLARERGYALTRGQLQSGAIGLATGFAVLQGPELTLHCSVGIVALDEVAEAPAIQHVRQAAHRLART